MLERKSFWYSLQAGSLAVWVFNIIGLVKPYGNETLRKLWRVTTPVWVVLHPLELPLAYWFSAKKAGLPLGRTVVKTLLYGFTWWVPVRRGVLDK